MTMTLNREHMVILTKEETSTIYLVVSVQSCEAWPKYLPYNVADTIAIIIICVCVNKFGYKII